MVFKKEVFKMLGLQNFHDKEGRYAKDAFTKTGFNNWKNALEKFNQHVGAANSCHNNARIQFEAFQGQRHSVANMISPRIQKELANACASEVTLAIVKDIGDRVFTILVDEARDVSLKEQMGVVLRYVNSEGYVIERFLGIVHVTDTCSRSLDQETTLVRPEDTLWGSHYSTLLRLCSMWPVVEKVLEIVRDDATILDNRSTTEGLIERMDNYEFVFTLHLMRHLLGTTNELSHALQRKDQNIVQAISLIQSVKHQLQSLGMMDGKPC
ncbi:uncharacterized protein LOC121745823 [Salvia splendens]|uniref:uncharacterized protein LOC121745823 n=1 Tax=Salvia splendens TaxID=180675 RepID=UPI001C2647D5|nr:uncharacterized protein LOC121745823 [Salvia splendens]